MSEHEQKHQGWTEKSASPNQQQVQVPSRDAWSRRAKPQPEWMASVRVGDVLTNGHAYRVVREVSRWRSVKLPGQRRQTVRGEGPLRFVTFTIKHCSWTGRCYTCVDATTLRLLGFRPAGVRVKLNKAIDAAVAACLDESDGMQGRSLKCCDVRGVA